MNLQEFTSPLPKPWLDINCNDLEAVSLVADTVVIETVDTKSVTLIQQPGVPNPTVGSSTLYCSSGDGVLHVNSATGTDLAYVTTPAQADLDLADYNLIGTGHIFPQVDAAADIGSPTHRFRTIELSGSVSGPTNTRTADNIVSNAGASIAGHLAVFADTTGKVITDGGALGGPYLPLVGGTMSGEIKMGNSQISDLSALRFNGTSMIVGSSASNVGNNNVVVGLSASTSGAAANAVSCGVNASVTAANGIAIGNTAAAQGSNAVCLGGSSTAAAVDSIAIGSSAVAAATGAICIGKSLTNVTADSVLVGSATVVNMRPGGTAVCDLGTTAARFKDAHLSGSLVGPTNTRTVDNIVSCAGASVDQRVAVFSGTSGKVITDGGALLSAYLPLAGGTMSGELKMGGQTISGFTLLAPNDTNVLIGQGASIVGLSNVVIGRLSSLTGTATNNVLLGAQATTSSNACVVIGTLASSTATGSAAVIGYASTTSGAGSVVIGPNLTCSGDNSISILSSNTTADSALIGSATCVNWRSAGNNVCDLGTSGLKFKDVYCRGIVGTTTNNNAQAGSVGEFVSSVVNSGSAVALTSGVDANVTSISLTAGDWDVSGSVSIAAAASTLVTTFYMSCSTTSATGDSVFAGLENVPFSAGGIRTMATPRKRLSLASTTTVYLIGQAIFTTSTCSAFGQIGARRVR